MKTGMELPLLGMVVAAIGLALWQAWQGLQVEMSVSALNATIAGQTMPEPVMIAKQGLLTAGMALAVVALTVGGGYALWQWRKKSARNEANAWKRGPNANWAKQPTEPRGPSEAELMRMALMRSLAGQGSAPPNPRVMMRQEGEDEPKIGF